MTTQPTLNDRRNLIAEHLGTCLDAAPASSRNALAQAIEDYATAAGAERWATMQRKLPAVAAGILDAMIEHTDARPGAQA